MDIPSTGRMFHTASQVFGTTSSSISATALVPASSKTIFLMALLHLLDDEVFLASVDHVFARLREAPQRGAATGSISHRRCSEHRPPIGLRWRRRFRPEWKCGSCETSV